MYEKRARRFLWGAALFGLLGYLVGRLSREEHQSPEHAAASLTAPHTAAPERTQPKGGFGRWAARRATSSLAFAVLFFAGAALTAGAGNEFGEIVDPAAPVATQAEPPAVTEPAPDENANPADQYSTDVSVPDVPAEPAAPEPEAPAPAPDPPAEPTEEPAPTVVETPPAESFTEDGPVLKSKPAAEQPASSEPEAPAPAAKAKPKPALALRAEPKAKSAAPATVKKPSRVAVKKTPKTRKPVQAKLPPLEPEAHAPGVSATIWLRNAVPAAIPQALPLSRGFADNLRRTSAWAGTDWALVLAVLRAKGEEEAVPASEVELTRLVKRLVGLRDHSERWSTVVAVTGRAEVADRALALARYYHVVGLDGLVQGLASQQWRLVNEVLGDERVSVYDGGRLDVSAGRIDVRVLALVEYLADTFGSVTVSSLMTGHRLYARPGVVSAHIYGRAVDVAALGGFSIYGNQQPGGITEQAVRQILLLPPEMMPRQVISLIGLGGPSFPLADHYDHIHVGY